MHNFHEVVLTLSLPLVMLGTVYSVEKSERPNIVVIIADDMGWDDVSFHGSDQIITPNIDLLAYTGVSLNRYYSHCMCTPSRSALLTGKFAHTLGMQGYPLTHAEDRGLSINEKILPQYLKDLGYATHLVGKWHVGLSRNEYLPTNRGFDSHFGHRGGYVDYYEYVAEENWNIGPVSGFDMNRNLSAAWDIEGYITDVYTKEAIKTINSHDTTLPLFLMVAHNAPHSANKDAKLQAPPEVVRSMRHVELPERRIYAAMVKKLDDSIGDIMKALADKGILENTIIIVLSDNGGITSGISENFSSNWPLRGIKMSPYEGAVRVIGVLWTANMAPNLWNGYIHVVDWLPTLLRAAGAEPPPGIDGIDLWHDIISNNTSKREEIFEIDDYSGFASMTFKEYKIITGNTDVNYSNHQGEYLNGIIGAAPSYRESLIGSSMYSILNKIQKTYNWEDIISQRTIMKLSCPEKNSSVLCYATEGKSCLFNIKDDPCEYRDVSEDNQILKSNMLLRLEEEMGRVKHRTVPLFRDPRSQPKLHNYAWTAWHVHLDMITLSSSVDAES